MEYIYNLGYYVGVSKDKATKTIVEFKKINSHLPHSDLVYFAFNTLKGMVVKPIKLVHFKSMVKQLASKRKTIVMISDMFSKYFGAGAKVNVIAIEDNKLIMDILNLNISTETAFDLQFTMNNGKRVYSLKPHDWTALS